MRRKIITKRNENSFVWSSAEAGDLLRTIDELLYLNDLELVVGDDGGSSDYALRVDKLDKYKEGEEYDADRTRAILYD